MVYFLIQLDEKSDSVAFQANFNPIIPHVLHLQCNILPHENCNNLPHAGGNFTRNTCPSKTHAHKAVTIPLMYTTCIYFIFLLCSISSCSGIFWRKVNFRKCKKFTRRGKNLFFFGNNFFIAVYDLQISHAVLV